jgi:AraC-like DNA-binding protein
MPTVHLGHQIRLSFARDWVMRRHVHETFHELIVVLAGAMEVRFDDGVVIGARAGDSLCYPCGVAHAERSVDRERLQMWCIGIVSDPQTESVGPVHATDIQGRARLLAQWMAEPGLPDAQEPARRDALLSALLLERMTALRPDQDLVRGVRRFVMSRLSKPIDLAELAEACGLSPFHFARRFREVAGLSPMRFVRNIRIEQARTMLVSSNLPMKRIAAEVGFADHHQLSRVFRRELDQPPSAYRATRRPTLPG